MRQPSARRDAVDHVVVATEPLARTCGAIADATGAALKQVREVGALRQGFHRVGGLVVEVVEQRRPPGRTGHLWGCVLSSRTSMPPELLGDDALGEPRDAVQPGRRIATVRDAVGLGVPVALMTD